MSQYSSTVVVTVSLVATLALVPTLALGPGPAGSEQPPAGQAPRPAAEPIGLDATEEQILRTVGAVRAGRKLTPRPWPNGARVAVALTFDVDNELLSRNNPLPVPLSQGQYGATTALPRVLSVLERHGVPATFFVPAVSAMIDKELLPSILRAKRHEIGVHGWIHENLPSINDAATERRLLVQSIDYLTKATGKRPVGYRAPSWAFSAHTLPQLLEQGFLYDSSFMAMDEPYELVQHGKPTGLIELPIEWILDDYPYFGPTAAGSSPSPAAVYDIYRAEFDAAYDEGTLFVLTTHPHVIGHRSRAAQLDKLIGYIKSRPGAWIATMEQIALAIKAQR
jgi:peptidoglycan/xylan/chitin deacetylase (PgdA/CDA1 family)